MLQTTLRVGVLSTLAALAVGCAPTMPTEDGGADPVGPGDGLGGGGDGAGGDGGDGGEGGGEPVARCAAQDSYGAVTGLGDFTLFGPQMAAPENDVYIFYGSGLDGSGALPSDDLMIFLWDGYGAFTEAPIAPGTYTIAGEETLTATCGICIYLRGQVDAESVPALEYIAKSGTLTIDSIDGVLSGSLANATFEGIAADADETPVPECTSAIERADFAAPLEPL